MKSALSDRLIAMLAELSRQRREDDELPTSTEWPAITVRITEARHRRVVFATKLTSILRTAADEYAVPPDLILAEHYGLGLGPYLPLLASLRERAIDKTIRVVADLDPLDLTILATLEANGELTSWRPNDETLTHFADSELQRCAIRMTPFECVHRDLLLRNFDVERNVGKRLCRLLTSGYKLEIEGLCTMASRVASLHGLCVGLFEAE